MNTQAYIYSQYTTHRWADILLILFEMIKNINRPYFYNYQSMW